MNNLDLLQPRVTARLERAHRIKPQPLNGD
jgi:hypothetical protein